MEKNIEMYASVGSFFLALISLIWSKSNSAKIITIENKIGNQEVVARDIGAKMVNVNGKKNITAVGNIVTKKR